ncbi:MAG: hypothetical protein M1837_004174 [Sclerophora amabilis]|nr:MAG: hypothetical protein M1837_004174 [Sclerophora amabilis]
MKIVHMTVPIEIGEENPESTGRTARDRFLSISLPVVAVALAVVAIVVLGYSGAYVGKPGPSTQYNHFTALFLSACLLFEAFQLGFMKKLPITGTQARVFRCISWIYWVVITLTSFMSFVAYAVCHKPDCAATQFFSSLGGMAALAFLVLGWTRTAKDGEPKRWKRVCLQVFRYFNRLLKFAHWCFCILIVSGSISLCLQYRYENPGVVYEVPFKDGTTRDINVHCTTVKATNGTMLPTIWFESTPAHGITDFLGVQHFLETAHGRNSCSYDHPSFGWSQPPLKDFTNSSMYWASMLKVLGREKEPAIIAGWGGGAEDALSHAIEMPEVTKGLVIMDSSPDGIEWMDIKRNNRWTEEQMLEFRQTDLETRVASTQLLLTLGLTWGLMPVFVPVDASIYYDTSLYPRHRAQSLKEDMWAHQYYALLTMLHGPISTYLTSTVVPSSIPVYSLMTRNSNRNDPASNEYQRMLKQDLVSHVAGGKDRVKMWAECVDADCDLGFLVRKAQWTAAALVELDV